MSLVISIIALAVLFATIFVTTGLFDKMFGAKSAIRRTLNEDISTRKKKVYLTGDLNYMTLSSLVDTVNSDPKKHLYDFYEQLAERNAVIETKIKKVDGELKLTEVVLTVNEKKIFFHNYYS